MSEDMDGKVQVIQNTLYARASREHNAKFEKLYRNLYKAEWALQAVNKVLQNKGSLTPGTDAKTRKDYRDEGKKMALALMIIDELRDQTYQPLPVRRTYIPKANGKLRPLGIPTIKDRVVQQMVKMLLEPIYEAIFLPCSYGFRPNRCTWDALAEIYYFLQNPRRYNIIVEGDITNCFGTIHHGTLMNQLKQRIQDDRLLDVIWKMLQAGYMEDLQYYATTEGTPQGGIVSPLLANVYMHQLDEWLYYRFHNLNSSKKQRMARKGEIAFVRHIRYADDFVIMTRSEKDAMTLKQEVADFVTQKLRMTLSDEKTAITDASQGFDFLGVCTILQEKNGSRKPMPYQFPSAKAMKSYRIKLKELTRRDRDHIDPVERILAINRLILGWANYHKWGNAKAAFRKQTYWTGIKVNHMLSRRLRRGKKAFRQANMKPLSECANLTRWKRYTVWKTPSAKTRQELRIDLIPMSVISTGEYWKYRGNKIPPAYGWPDRKDLRYRSTDFLTDTQIIETIVADAEEIGFRLDYRRIYSIEYFVNRREALKRDDFTCTQCGYRSKRGKDDISDLQVHHLDHNGDNNLDNLITVCLNCHRKLTAIEQSS